MGGRLYPVGMWPDLLYSGPRSMAPRPPRGGLISLWQSEWSVARWSRIQQNSALGVSWHPGERTPDSSLPPGLWLWECRCVPGGIHCAHILSWALHWVGLEGRGHEGGESPSRSFQLRWVIAKRRGSGRTSWRMAVRMAMGKGKRVSQAEEEMCKRRAAGPCCTLEAQNHPV